MTSGVERRVVRAARSRGPSPARDRSASGRVGRVRSRVSTNDTGTRRRRRSRDASAGGRTTSTVGPRPVSTSAKPTAASAGPIVGSGTTTQSMVIVTVLGPVVGSMSTRWPSAPSERSSSSTVSGGRSSTAIVTSPDVAHGRRSPAAAAASRGRSARRSSSSSCSPIGSDRSADHATPSSGRRRRHHRAVLRPVGERLAVRRRAGRAPDRPGRRRSAPRRSIAEHGQALVGRVRAQHVRCGRVVVLGEADDVLRAAPVVGTVAVGVGDDDLGGRSVGASSSPAATRVADQLVAVEEPGGGGVDEAVAAARDEHDVVLGPHDRHRRRRRARARPAAIGVPTRGSDTDCSSTIGMSGVVGRPGRRTATRRPSPGAPAANRSWTSSGRGVRKRSKAASPVSQIVSAPSRRATGAIAAGSTVPDWKRSSRAYSRSIAAALPSGSRSRVTSGLSVMPGQRRVDGVAPAEGAELLPRAAAARARPVSPASRAAAASVHAAGGSWSRSMRRVDPAVPGERRAGWRRRARRRATASDRAPRHAAGAGATRAAARRRARRRRGRARARASARRACSSAGRARRPTCRRRAARSISGDGSSIGWTPTPSTTPVDDEGDGEAAVRPARRDEPGERR